MTCSFFIHEKDLNLLKNHCGERILYCVYGHMDTHPRMYLWLVFETGVIRLANKMCESDDEFVTKYFGGEYCQIFIEPSQLSEISKENEFFDVSEFSVNERLTSFDILRDSVCWSDPLERELLWDMGIILHLETKDLVFQLEDTAAEMFTMFTCDAGECNSHLRSFQDAAIFEPFEEQHPVYKREFIKG